MMILMMTIMMMILMMKTMIYIMVECISVSGDKKVTSSWIVVDDDDMYYNIQMQISFSPPPLAHAYSSLVSARAVFNYTFAMFREDMYN